MLKAGAAKTRITPPAGIPFLGHGARVSQGIHDDLWARSLVLEDDGEKVAIIALDLCWPLPKNDYLKVRREVESRTDIKGGNILVSATHSHSGPTFSATTEDYPMPLKRRRELIDPWVESLPRRISESVVKANSNLVEAKVSFGKTLMNGICYNRRIRIPDGVITHTGSIETLEGFVREFYLRLGASPEEAEKIGLRLPDGPIDPEVAVLRVDDSEKGKPLAVLVNYACHAVASFGPLISAGYPGYTSYFVEQATGAVCLFTSGCGGDVRTYHRRETSELKEAYRIGLVLSTAVLKAMKEAQPIENPRVRVASKTLQLDWREYPDLSKIGEVIEEKRRLFDKAKAEGRIRDAKKIYDELRVLNAANGSLLREILAEKERMEKIPVELQAIGIGDVVLVTFPHEVSVEIGLTIKRRAWTDKVIPITLANGIWMYLIMRRHYEEGGYENAYCIVAPGTAELEIEASLQLIESLKM